MILGRMLTAGGSDGAAGFTSAYLTRASGVTGLVDNKVGTVSAFYYIASPDDLRVIGVARSGDDNLYIGSEFGTLQIFGRNAEGVRLNMHSVASLSTNRWAHLMASWDLSVSSRRHIYLDGSPSLSVTSFEDDVVTYTGREFAVGRSFGGGSYTGRFAEVWFDDVYIDLSQSANRLKFRAADGTPAKMGATGQNPTGSTPLVYFPRFLQMRAGRNLGTGGDFVLSGMITRVLGGPW